MTVDTTAGGEDLEFWPMPRQEPLQPPPALVRRADQCPVSRVRIWDDSAPWLVTGYEDYRTALADQRLSVDPGRAGYPCFTQALADHRERFPSFISFDDPEHGYFRRMLQADFSVRRVEALRPRVSDLVARLLDDMERQEQPVDLVQAFCLPLASQLICLIMGIPYEFHTEFQQYAGLITYDGTTVETMAAADERMHQFYAGFIAEKREHPSDDLLSRLVNDRLDTGQLTEDQLLAILDLLLVAGHDTTANQIALGLIALLDDPEQLAVLRDTEDPHVVKSAVEELLRFVTVTQWGRRRVATEDLEIGGQRIRAGEGVIMASESANRDPIMFPDPDRLDLGRDTARHVEFGFGVHQCLGQNLARVELSEAYPGLLRRLRDVRIAVPVEELEFKGNSIVYGVKALPIEWDRSMA